MSLKAVVLNAPFKASSTRWLKQWISCSQLAFSCTNLSTPLCFPKLTLAQSTLIPTNFSDYFKKTLKDYFQFFQRYLQYSVLLRVRLQLQL